MVVSGVIKVDVATRFSATDCGTRCRCTAALRRMKFVPLAELFAPARGHLPFPYFSSRCFSRPPGRLPGRTKQFAFFPSMSRFRIDEVTMARAELAIDFFSGQPRKQ